MAELSILALAAILLLTALISIAALVLWARLSPDPDQARHALVTRESGQTVFLFEGFDLVDTTPPAQKVMDGMARAGTDLDRLLQGLSGRFADLPTAAELTAAPFERTFLPRDASDPLRLHFDSWDGYLRARLSGTDDDGAHTDHGEKDGTGELAILRAMSDEAPFLMWQTDKDGRIQWANEAYLAELAGPAGASSTVASEWPPAPLFTNHAPGKDPIRLPAKNSNTRRFDIQSLERGDRWFHFAASAEAAEKAEAAQKDFVQTLTKTFAHLSIGLVIFDHKRELALFNPALVDLMPIPVAFLSQRPTLYRFLDKLREERLIAEPRNYKAWRKHILELETRAAEGSYCETWALPGGTTFRVTGRPHPDGAIAFLFEDISAEVSLTRRFHAEIELGHAALDAMEEAVAILSPAGVVTLTNGAYRALWGPGPDEGLLPTRLSDVTKTWSAGTVADPGLWDTLIAHADRQGSAPWRGDALLKDGRHLHARAQRLQGGALLVGFKTSAPLSSVVSDFAARRREAAHMRKATMIPEKVAS
ncbi:MAG: PAS-domain containing protein [Pseudomonadota bacterium]